LEHPLFQAKRKPVKEYYPIYDDSTGAGGWQADLMFMNYTTKQNNSRRHTFLCLININTKYAFVRQLIFNRSNPKKEEDELWKRGKKNAPGTTNASLKTAVNCRTALKNIIDIDMAREERHMQEKGPKEEAKDMFNVEVIYTDEGNEFKAEFDQFCREREIRHVVFKPGEGKKTRLGIVERFNRTLREYYKKWCDDNPNANHYFPNVLPKVLEIYNRQKDHKGVRKGMKDSIGGERLKYGMEATPMAMMLNMEKDPKVNDRYIMGKKWRTQRADKEWKHDIAKLKRKPRVRFFKNVLDPKEQFVKSGDGNLSNIHNVIGQNPRGKSWKLDNKTGMKLLPYDLHIL
jgi:hypothetical protein